MLLFVAGVVNFVDPDMFHGLALIRESLRLGRLPLEDQFAYTPTVYPVVHHEWAAEALLYFTAVKGGAMGILALKYLLMGGIAAGSFMVAAKRGASLAVLSPLAPIAILMSWIGMTTIRAQVFTLLFLVILLWFLETDRRGGRNWILPWLFTHLLWLNCHAGFLVGLALFIIHVVERVARREPARHLFLTGLSMVALIAANPYGLDYYSYLLRATRLDRSLISEWLPVWRAWPPIVAVYMISLAVLAYALWRKGLRGAPGFPLVLAAACAALRYQRHLSVYAVVWLCYVPSLIETTRLGAMLRDISDRHRRRLLLVWGIVAACGIAGIAIQKPWNLRIPAREGEQKEVAYPVGAAEYLREARFEGNLMTPFVVGAFVTWKLHPAVKVSLDGRYEVAYPPGALEEQRKFYRAEPGLREVLDKYPVDAVLVRSSERVSRALREVWPIVYQDDVYEVFARPGLALPRVDRRGQRLSGTFP